MNHNISRQQRVNTGVSLISSVYKEPLTSLILWVVQNAYTENGEKVTQKKIAEITGIDGARISRTYVNGGSK